MKFLSWALRAVKRIRKIVAKRNGLPARDLQNSEIRFGIVISKTEPCSTEQFLEFWKSRNSEKSRFMEGCQKDWWKSNNAGHLQHTHFTMFRYADDANDLWIPNQFRTVPRNLMNSVPNRFRRIFDVPNRTELWKAIPQTLPLIDHYLSESGASKPRHHTPDVV